MYHPLKKGFKPRHGCGEVSITLLFYPAVNTFWAEVTDTLFGSLNINLASPVSCLLGARDVLIHS